LENLQEAIGSRPGIDSTLVLLESDPKELVSHIPPFSLNWTLKSGIVMRSRIRAMEKDGKVFDAALFNHVTPVSLLGTFSKRVPVFLSLDATPQLLDRYGLWYNAPAASKLNPIELLKHQHVRRVYGGATYLLPWSRWVRDSLVHDYGVDEKKIRVVPPGIDLKKWSGAGTHGTPHGAKTRILFVGGEFERKGGDLLVNVAARPEFRDCEFHIVTRSSVRNAGANVVVHANLAANSPALITLYEDANIFALPTRADVFSIAGLEAMAMGLPVIITNVGGTAEIVRDNENGYVIPVDDEHALADKLLRLVKNTDLRKQLGEKGRKIVETDFNLDKIADVIFELMVHAADSKHPRSASYLP
jgi:glycosyltransferase involved in cell wall biosynthesis